VARLVGVIAPTGTQYSLVRATPLGEARATITQLAASLRGFSIGGVDLTQPYAEDSVPPFACGIVLVPWPNRIEDGVWTLDGREQQLDLTEPDRHNAIHGLLRNAGYDLVEQSADAVTLGATVFPQHGYPFHLDTTVRYALVDDGLDVTHVIRNIGSAKAPVAVGTHPFLTIGDAPADELVLTVHASTRFEVDARLNPIRESPVDGTEYDLRGGRPLAELQLDDAFGGVEAVDGVAARLTAPDGREVRLRQDENHPYVQVFTTREYPGAQIAVAIEPMTAPANAFNSGLGVKWLEPGEQWSVNWGIQYSA
jgi:aldose 1-epimerase